MARASALIRNTLLWASLLVFGVWLLAAGDVLADAPAQKDAAEPAESVEYRRTVEDALEEYQLGHFEEARGLFQHAHELEPSARTLRGLGMVEFELRHYPAAAELLQQALRDRRKSLTDEQRTAVEQLLVKTSHFTARYRLEITPADVPHSLELDGAPLPPPPEHVLTLTAGEHLLRVSAEAHAPAELKLDAKGGEQRTLTIELRALDPASVARASLPARESAPRVVHPHRKLGIVLGAVGVAALGAGLAVGALAVNKAEDAVAGGVVDDDLKGQARTMGWVADTLIIAGAASAVAGVVLLLRRKTERSAAHARRGLGRFHSSLGSHAHLRAPTMGVRF